MQKEVYIWKPISFNENWLSVSTVKFDNIAPSWYRKRELLKENEIEYEKFLERLKRQQAIETGIIERLYDLKEGITETFIKEGFVESYLQHGDTNIPPKKLMNYLTDHFDAIDFIFDFVKENRRVSKSFIMELHQLITSHQDVVDAMDQTGNLIQVRMLKGQFKKYPNNPKRDNENIKFLYCPPEQVESEIDKLLDIYNELETRNVHPIIRSAFFHQCFTQIHPFQDGNGRIARLMASLILVKDNLFPFTINRTEKKKYIDSLEEADNGQFQNIVSLFSEIQIRNIESALNWKTVSNEQNLNQVLNVFSLKVKKLRSEEAEKRREELDHNREDIFNYISNVMQRLVDSLKNNLSSLANIAIRSNKPNTDKFYFFTHQIAQYATKHNYYFNASLPRGWVRINIKISEERNYNLIISLHHYGYDDGTLAIGAFLELISKKKLENNPNRRALKTGKEEYFVSIPLEIKPLTISAELNVKQLEDNLESYLQDVFTLALAHLSNEI